MSMQKTTYLDALQHIASARWQEEETVERLCDYADRVIEKAEEQWTESPVLLSSDTLTEIQNFAVSRRFAVGDLEHHVRRWVARERNNAS